MRDRAPGEGFDPDATVDLRGRPASQPRGRRTAVIAALALTAAGATGVGWVFLGNDEHRSPPAPNQPFAALTTPSANPVGPGPGAVSPQPGAGLAVSPGPVPTPGASPPAGPPTEQIASLAPPMAAPPAQIQDPTSTPPPANAPASPSPAVAPAPSPSTSSPPSESKVGEFSVIEADESHILASRSHALTIYRFSSNPDVLLLDFPTLDEQADMLNRIAIFIEKANAPHDHVLADNAVAELIRRDGETAATIYYGHDYRAADLVRFFATADRDHVKLHPAELRLRRLITAVGWLDANASGALLSIPQESQAIDANARRVILHHELSHGEYFTRPDYARHAWSFWTDVMNDHDRAAFKRFLSEGRYDPKIEDLMVDETQAYLMFTPDDRYFSATIVGLPPSRVDGLRRAFLRSIPAGWAHEAAIQ